MKATIVGTGAIGGRMAALLSEAGWEVPLLARLPYLDLAVPKIRAVLSLLRLRALQITD